MSQIEATESMMEFGASNVVHNQRGQYSRRTSALNTLFPAVGGVNPAITPPEGKGTPVLKDSQQVKCDIPMLQRNQLSGFSDIQSHNF